MKKVAVVCALAFVAALVLSTSERAQARPQYLKAFAGKYEKVAEKAKELKCGVCHPEKSKKVKTAYGSALGKHTGKNQKDVEKIGAALDAAGKEKSEGGKTYGEILEGGELPK